MVEKIVRIICATSLLLAPAAHAIQPARTLEVHFSKPCLAPLTTVIAIVRGKEDIRATLHGDETKMEPQRLLGAVVSAIQTKPTLSPDDITAGESFLGLGITGLATQPERVRFTPTALSLEEFSKLWSVFFQVEYALSAAYQASVVLIDSDTAPQESLPVRTRNVYVAPFRSPFIERVISQDGADQPILAGGEVRMTNGVFIGRRRTPSRRF